MNSRIHAQTLNISHQTAEEIVTQTLLPGFIKSHAVHQILDGLRGQQNLSQDCESLRLACSQATSLDFPD